MQILCNTTKDICLYLYIRYQNIYNVIIKLNHTPNFRQALVVPAMYFFLSPPRVLDSSEMLNDAARWDSPSKHEIPQMCSFFFCPFFFISIFVGMVGSDQEGSIPPLAGSKAG